MIYKLSKNFVLLSALFLLVWFGFADTNIASYWSAEWRDAGMIKQNIQDVSCKAKDWTCCKGNVCMWVSVNCIQWTTPAMLWCNEKCVPIVECKKYNLEKNLLKKSESNTKEGLENNWNIKNIWSKLDKVDKNLLKRFNIDAENETEDEVKNKVKNVKIEKINDMWNKLENIIEKTESLNYNPSKLKNYIETFKNIKSNLNRWGLTSVETKKYNKELNNLMANIQQELSNIKNTYKSQ